MARRDWVVAAIVVAVGALMSARVTLRADDEKGREVTAGGPRQAMPADASARSGEGKRSVQDWMLKPFDFPFGQPTSLAEVSHHLSKALDAPVVLDVAALKRLDITPDERVQLELHGVRLKTGLKLLLDQVGLAYRIVSEDNLLILTDAQGSEDPFDRVFQELKSLHRDIHEVQDELDDLRADLFVDDGGGPRMRKPTIIEELPGEADPKPAAPPSTAPGRPRS
jgi:hypothetical protein